MLIVYPVTIADFKLAELNTTLIGRFGGIRPHKLLMVFSESCPSASRKKIEKILSTVSDDVFSHDLETRDERGWPKSANSVFAEVARVVTENGCYGEKGWYFMEADNTPLRAEWANLLDREYKLARLPYMGVKHITHRGIGPARREAGYHMVGTGVYPADFFYSCRLAKHLTSISDPFDVALQWEVVPQMHPTDQILHNWSSHKYEKGRDGVITCRAFREGVGITHPIAPDHIYSVVHGCKDASLPKLVAATIK